METKKNGYPYFIQNQFDETEVSGINSINENRN